MRVIQRIDEMKSVIRAARREGRTVGLVPTMGFLHKGHLTLMKAAKAKTDVVVISIFVNPLQFGVGEDYAEYPRDLSRDTHLAEEVGVDFIFAPEVKEMYPKGYATFVEVEGLTDKLCGKSRPGHFRGVTTVVNKLFNVIQPDRAFFGQKDAQQVLILQKMARDLNMNLSIEVVPTVRENDGLALSSRNAYLSPEERQSAPILSQSLKAAQRLIGEGERSAAAVKEKISTMIKEKPLTRIDYVEIYTMPDLAETDMLEGKNLIALAVFVGRTRLIDNMVVEV